MKNKKIKIPLISILVASCVFLMASVAFAQGPTGLDDIRTLLETVADWFQAIVLIIGVIMIIAAGLTWMTAGGNEEKLTKARRMFIWGLVGIAVALFAYTAETFILDIIGA